MPLNKKKVILLISWNAPNMFNLIKKLVEMLKGHYICWTLFSGDSLSLKNILSVVLFVAYSIKDPVSSLYRAKDPGWKPESVIPTDSDNGAVLTQIFEGPWLPTLRPLTASSAPMCCEIKGVHKKKKRHEWGTGEHVKNIFHIVL